MVFEALANELLLEVFQYLNISQLFRAFQSLNSRFNHLLFIRLQNFRHLDFRSISKYDFNFICQHHLQSIAHQILSLTLSNNDESPQQIELFFSRGFTLHQFPHLQSLSFYQIHSHTIIQDIVIDLLHLSNLIYLNFMDCCLSSLDDKIWKIPKLIYLQLHDTSNEKPHFIVSRSFSSSIESISIKNYCMNMNDIYHLLKHKPHLRRVKIYAHLDDEDINVGGIFPSITTFELYDERSYPQKIYFTNHIPRAVCLLRAMPNLCHLTIETPFIFMDGYRWKCLITNFLPKLKIFRFKMSIYFNNFDTIKSRIDYIFNSFQNQFWIDEHQWFIRCHWNSEDKYSQYILFYTCPYHFSHLSIPNNHRWSKSTCLYHDNHWLSSRVHCLSYNSLLIEQNISLNKFESCLELNSINSSSKINKIFRFNPKKSGSFSLTDDNSTIIPSSFEKTIKITSLTSNLTETSPILHFPNIYQLTVELPLDEYFWWIIPKLDRLTSLNIKSSIQNINQTHLKTLLDRAPRLYSLSFNFDLTKSKLLLFNNSNTLIRRLDFKGTISLDQCPFFSHEQCIALSQSSLGKQCEVLLIGLKHRRSILFLIKTMIHLRALNVRCQDDQYGSKTSPPEYDEFIHWLRDHLSSKVTIEREIRYNHDIRLWIR